MRVYYNDFELSRKLDDANRNAMTWGGAYIACRQLILAAGYVCDTQIMVCLNQDYDSYDRYWQKRVDKRVHEHGEHIIIGTECYFLHTNEPIAKRGDGPLGFSGYEFKIRMFDGRNYVTNNLWGNGEVPPRFRDKLPPNAEFVKDFNQE